MSLVAMQAQAELTAAQIRLLAVPAGEICPARTGAWRLQDGFNVLLVHRWIRTPIGMVCAFCRGDG